MVNAEGVAMVNGTPKALAARARISSAPQRPALMPPVGAMASGRADFLPKISVLVSTCATSTSTLGSRRTRSKAARFSRSVTSSSAPPSQKSKIARGRCRRALARRSSTLTAWERSGIGQPEEILHFRIRRRLEREDVRLVAAGGVVVPAESRALDRAGERLRREAGLVREKVVAA